MNPSSQRAQQMESSSGLAAELFCGPRMLTYPQINDFQGISDFGERKYVPEPFAEREESCPKSLSRGIRAAFAERNLLNPFYPWLYSATNLSRS
jgi:hypothetical protein